MFPRFKKKVGSTPSFRVRNKHPRGGNPAIRVGDGNRPRSVTVPGVGQITVHDDTRRRLRRMLIKGRARICYATISHHGGDWWVSLNIEAVDPHAGLQHRSRGSQDDGGWIGVDRGLSAFAVAADTAGTEVARIANAPKALAAGLKRQRRLVKKLAGAKKGGVNRRGAAAKLAGPTDLRCRVG